MRISFTALTGAGPRDVVMDVGDEATVDAVAQSLTALLDGRAPHVADAGGRAGRPWRALWMDGRMLDPQALAVKELRDGAVVAVERRGAAATVLAEPTGLVEVRVVGGPAAGSVHRLGIGVSTIGSGRDVDVVLDDPSVPARSLRLTVGRETVEVEASEPTMRGAATLDGTPLAAKAMWPVGGLLRVGSSVLALGPSGAPDAHLEPLPEGGLAFDRPPRAAPVRHVRRLDVPHSPEQGALDRLRVFGRRSSKEFERRSAEFDAELERLRREDEAERRALHPDPAEVLLTATGPRRRLWERRPGDPDVLQLRIGLADLPARIELGGDSGRIPSVDARMVPVTVPLTESGVVGVAGPRRVSRALARWMVAQAAALHSPRDLAIVVLSADPDAGEEWNWVRWLPHCAPREGEDCVALVGTDAESAARRVTELAIRLTERRRAAGQAEPVPYNILVVLDGARTLRRVPGMPMLLSRGAEFGIYAICVDDEERLLPEECRAAAVCDPQYSATVRLRGPGYDFPVLADQVSPTWTDRVARALAPVRDVPRAAAADPIPAEVRLLDVLDMPEPTADHVLRSWTRTGGRTARVPVGTGPACRPHEIDLRADGPHALVAGTAGAGTSELLRTLVASLAVANRPDEMTFVLIGAEDAARFRECARLPHTVGVVTGLDDRAAERALESLAAELRRREEVLLDAGAKDLDAYDDLRPGRPDLPSVPRLVLVVDELAETPGFVTGLLDVGRRGRPLGVHLVLATRHPAAAVTGDIRAATDLRIALRVTTPAESTEVLDSPDAAHIPTSTPGRCYIRSGESPPAAVQVAQVGGRHPRAGTNGSGTTVVPLPWQSLGHPLPDPRKALPGADDDATDLGVLVQAIDEAARRAGIDREPSPWLNPLPDRLTLAPRYAAGGSVVDVPPITFGVTDLPAVQSREDLALDLAGGGHLYIAGSARSGRSTALRTIAGSLAAACSPYDAHLYAIDCGANALLPLTALPHCGAVVPRDHLDRCERLLSALTAEVTRRRNLLAEAGFASLAEQRASVAATDRLPWMVLLLDGWEGFLGAFEHHDQGRLVDQTVRLLDDGAAVGLRAVVTGDRSGLGGQLSAAFARRLLLRMDDPDDYGYGGLGDRQVPAAMPPGRALEPPGPAEPGAPPRESQIALLGDDPSGAGQAAALQEIARTCVSRYGRLPRRRRPLRVDELPDRVTYREAMSLDREFLAPSALWALVGVGGDTLAPVGVDLRTDGPGFTVAGPPRSGRSTTLRTIVHSLLDPAVGGGLVPVVLVTPRRSPLRLLSGHPGVLGLLTSGSGTADLLAAIGDEHRFAVVVDDAELLDRTALDDALRDVLRTARDGAHAVVIGGTTADLGTGRRGFISEARRSRSGVLLSVESPDDGDLFGLSLPRNAPLGGPTGRGLFVAMGATTQIQVALPPPAAGTD
ncbi:cell division protein FtsK [Actinomadura sp. KC216]|uniref:FtsK/SpoIIIE domain-containing protein n=1 Tax=Actinomadura sp. KC216 TaxID=2530370 RepID=UPI001052DE27|nr:FtsK/SpoIIIE domain-containing protein [Actinomadura sp. KC216]TDB83754.1 cell division protein FtsK [Actinomadura sp. KC216]